MFVPAVCESDCDCWGESDCVGDSSSDAEPKVDDCELLMDTEIENSREPLFEPVLENVMSRVNVAFDRVAEKEASRVVDPLLKECVCLDLEVDCVWETVAEVDHSPDFDDVGDALLASCDTESVRDKL